MDNGQEGGLEPYHEELLGEPGGADCGQGQAWGQDNLKRL